MLRVSLGSCFVLFACASHEKPAEEPATQPTPEPVEEPAPSSSEDAGPPPEDFSMMANLPTTEREVLAKIRVQAATCFRIALQQKAELPAGLPRIRFTLDKDGVIHKAQVVCSPLPKELTQCLRDGFIGLPMPAGTAKKFEAGPECPGKPGTR